MFNTKRVRNGICIVLLFCVSFGIYEIWPENIRGRVVQSYGEIQGSLHYTPYLSARFWLDDTLFANRNNEIFQSKDKGLTWTKVAQIPHRYRGPLNQIRTWFINLKTTRRFFKFYPIPLHVQRNGTILAVFDGIHSAQLQEGKVVTMSKVHGSRRCLLHGMDQDNHGNLYYGEYRLGDHSSTRLWWSQDSGATWHERYKFDRSEIAHIHSVAKDPYTDLLWITTGDEDHESRILFSANQGKSFDAIGSGGQNWRTVSLQFSQDAIYWGTDIPTDNNHLFYFDRKKRSEQKLLTVRNPFYYSATDQMGNYYFSTGAEIPEYGGEIYSELYRLNGNQQLESLLKWQRGPYYYSGMIVFAQGRSPAGWVALSPMNLKDHLCEVVVFKSIEVKKNMP